MGAVVKTVVGMVSSKASAMSSSAAAIAVLRRAARSRAAARAARRAAAAIAAVGGLGMGRAAALAQPERVAASQFPAKRVRHGGERKRRVKCGGRRPGSCRALLFRKVALVW